MKSLFLKTEEVDLNDLCVIQGNLKDLTLPNYNKLKNSIIENGFFDMPCVWQENRAIWIISGTHRIYALKKMRLDGESVPDKITCVFIKAESRDHAKKLVLMASSQYAKVTEEGLDEFLNSFDVPDDIKSLDSLKDLELSSINLDKFEKGYFTEFSELDDNTESNPQGDVDNSKQSDSNQKYVVRVELKTEEEQFKLFEELTNRDLNCKMG